MNKRRRGKRKAKTRTRTKGKARVEQRGGTEFHAHLKLAQKLVKKLRRKVAAFGPKKRRK